MIKVLHKAAIIIDIVYEEKCISFSNIYSLSGLNRSTVSHILSTLFKMNYLDKDKSGNYRIGEKLLLFSCDVNYKTVLMDIASRAADNLLERINELTVIAMCYNGMRLTLVKKRPMKILQVMYKESTSPASWHTTASGRLLMAYQDASEREKIISKISLPGANIWPEVKDHDSHIVELNKIRKQNYALIQIDETINSIAVPMVDAENKYCFSISCALPVLTYNNLTQKKIIEHMQDVAVQFSTEIKLNNIKVSEGAFIDVSS